LSDAVSGCIRAIKGLAPPRAGAVTIEETDAAIAEAAATRSGTRAGVMGRVWIGSALLVLGAAAACSPQTPLQPASQPTPAQTDQSQRPALKVVGLADNGATVTLEPGQLLRIELEGTPTAGYAWQLLPLPDRARLVSQTSRPSNPEGRAAGMVGGNDWSVFTVDSTSPTRVTIELVYGRPWELQAGAAPERRFRIDTVMAVN